MSVEREPDETEKILELFKEDKKIDYSKFRNVILVLGAAGSGKKALTEFIGKNNHYFESQSIESNVTEFTADNLNQIYTALPTTLEDSEENVAFYVFPGLPGFRLEVNRVRDIALCYYIKRVLDSAASVKLIFTISYSRDTLFEDLHYLFSHASALIKDLEKYKTSVAIVATKFEESENGVFVPGQVAINKIAEKMQYIRKVTEDKRIVHFIDNLLEKDEHENYKKIGIMRKLNRVGEFSRITLLQENKRYLKKMIQENVKFSTYDKSDFNYTTFFSVKLTAYDLFDKVEEKLVYDLRSIRPEIEKYYYKQEEQSHDIYELYNKTQSWNDTFAAQQESISQCADLRCAINRLTVMIIDHDVCPTNEHFSNIKNYFKYLKFVSALTDTQSMSHRLAAWIQEFSNGIQTYLDDSKKWYDFFIYLHDALSNYDVQRNVHKISNLNLVDCQSQEEVTIIECNFESAIESISATLLNDIKKNDSYINVMDLKLDEIKQKFLNMIWNKTVKNKVIYSCDKDKKLSIKGYNVKLSSMMESDDRLECFHEVKVIEIFALNKVLIDTGFERAGDELQLSIIAPAWEVIFKSSDIFLDGMDGEKYPALASDGLGRDGRAGKPGGPAGSFLGIGQRIVKGENFHISARGGDGGPGENGDDGAEVQHADPVYTVHIPENGKFSTEPEWHSDSCKTDRILEDEEVMASPLWGGLTRKKKWNGTCTFNSGHCTDGGDGGDGGAGGLGGNNGDILLFAITDKEKINIYNTKGERGIDGKGGIGSKGGKRLLKLNFLATTKYESTPAYDAFPYYKNFVYNVDENVTRCLPGKNGTAGKSLKNLQKPKPAVTIYLPTIVNDYKSYLRENLKNGVVESSLRKFLDDLDEIDKYDTLGLVDELYGLEEQFYKLRKELPMLSFYESLQNRVKRYAEKLHSHKTLTEDDRKVLRYLYTAILSKICSMNNISAIDVSINITKHLDQAVNHINELENFVDITRKNSYLSDYQKEMDRKIEEATKYIDTITPDTKSVLNQVDGNIKKLIQATHVKRNESIEEANEIIKQKEKLKKSLILRIALGVPKVVSMLLVFLGPAGVAASLAIAGGLTIAESLLLDNIDNPKFSKLATLPTGVTLYLGKMAEVLRLEQQRMKTWIDDLSAIMDDSNLDKSDTLFFDIDTKLKGMREKFDKLDKDDYEAVEKLRKEQDEIEAMINVKRKKTEKEANGLKGKFDEKVAKRLSIIIKIQVAIELINASVNLGSDILKHKSMIGDVDKLLKQSRDKIKLLRKYEEKIYHIIIPIYRNLENSFTKTQNSLEGKSKVALDVSSWQIQSILNDAKFQLERLTADFDEQRDIFDNIRKLQDGMEITIKMYNYIQAYQERKGLTDLMANMNLNKAKEVLSNKKLNDAVDNLKLIVKSNFILEKYENAIDAFKQYVFPFAGVYFAKHHLPAFLQPNDTRSIATEVTKVIKDLQADIYDYNVGGSNYTQEYPKRYVGIKFGCPSDLIESFFVWKYNSYKPEIHRLLEGAEVVLKSDIRRGFDKNAIKFSEIGIQFRFANKTIQNDFDEEIKDYKITMVHSGLSYYRCDDKIYTFTSNNTQCLSYIAKKKCSERAQIRNLPSDQLGMSQAVLSPYAFWKIKLTNNHDTAQSLKIYKNQEVDLVLEGTGDYVDLDLDVCKDNLTKYYTLDDSTLEVEYFGFIKHKLLHHSFIPRNKRHHRVRRSIQMDDYIRDVEENSVLTNSGYSSVKSSYVNKLLSAISNSLIVFKNWMPKTDLLDWFDNEKEKVNHEMSSNLNIISYTEIQLLNVEPELPTISAQFTDGESATINSIFNNSSFCTNDNLLLLDLLIRRKSGIKRKQSNVLVSSNFDAQYAQNLAYGGHIA